MNILPGVEGFTLRLWTGVLGVPQEEVMATIEKVKQDLVNPKVHTYLPVYVQTQHMELLLLMILRYSVIGRKPEKA